MKKIKRKDFAIDILYDEVKKVYFFLIEDENGKFVRYEKKRKMDCYYYLLKIKKEIRSKNKDKAKKEIVDAIAINKKNKKSIAVHTLDKGQIIFEARLRGLTGKEIAELLVSEYGVKEITILEAVKKIDLEIAELSKATQEELWVLHNERYEDLYKMFRQLGSDKMAIKTLKHKEDLNGLHNQTVNIQINNFENSIEPYDLSKLLPNERQQLKQILSKIKEL